MVTCAPEGQARARPHVLTAPSVTAAEQGQTDDGRTTGCRPWTFGPLSILGSFVLHGL